jgi:UDP-2,4-diacetamido-2,4,6-trideoxy-beta-L-altropyranose hydrolase
MTSADLMIGGGGSTTWERCALKLPSIIIALAKNQIAIAEAVASKGAIFYLGTGEAVSTDDIAHALSICLDSPASLKQMGEKAGRLIDIKGKFHVADFLEKSL